MRFLDRLADGPLIVALIPARGGSRRIPRKNLQRVGRLTLLEHAITACANSNRIVETYVSTEDDEIKQVATKAGALVIDRPQILAGDEASTDHVMRHFLSVTGLRPQDIVVLVEPTAPMRTAADLDLVAELMTQTKAPAARMVLEDPLHCHGEVYRDSGLAQAIRVGMFKGCLFPRGTLLVHGGNPLSIDVNTYEDLERVRRAV
jgi:spore coat polysaccharide biosynthesis protein SpsF (cytidylyltransferase family)